MGSTTIGATQALFQANTSDFDAKLEASGKKMEMAAAYAKTMGDAVQESGAKTDRAASVMERAAERARRAWQQELIAQDRAIQADQAAARTKELAALKADILSRSLEKQAVAQNAVNASTEHSIPQYAAASAAVRMMEGGMTNNVRAAERFLSTTLGLGPALQVLFPIAGGVAFLDILVRMSTKVMELAQNWEGVHDAEVAAMKAIAESDQQHVAQAAEHARLVRERQMAQVGLNTPREGRGAAMAAVSTQFDLVDAQTKIEDLKTRIANAQQEIASGNLTERASKTRTEARNPLQTLGVALPTQMPTNDAQWAQSRLEELRANMSTDQGELRNLQQQILTMQDQQKLQQKEAGEGAGRHERRDASQQMGAWRQQLEAQKAGHAMTIDEEASYWQKLADSAKRGSVLYNAALMEANKARAASQVQYQQRFVGGTIEKMRSGEAADSSSDRVHAALQEQYVGDDTREREIKRQTEEGATRAFAAAEQQRKAADSLAEEAIRLQEQSGQLSRAGAAQALMTVHQESFANWSAASASFSAQFPNLAVPGATQALQEYGKQSQQHEAAQEATTSLGALREATDRMTQAFTDLPAHLVELVSSAISGFNGAFSSAVMAHADSGQEYRRNMTNALGGQFRSLGARGLDSALQTGEGGLMSKLGFGKSKPTGTQSDPLFVRLIAAAGAAGGTLDSTGAGSLLLSALGASGPVSTTGSSKGSFLSTVLPALTQMIPHLASGGPLSSNMPALVGENGPELFMPTSSGRIVPNGDFGGGGSGGDVHLHIDARGATDPASVEFAVQRGMNQVRREIAPIALAAHRQYNRARPGSSRM